MEKIKNPKLVSIFFGLVYGVFGSLGFLCLMNLYAMAVFHERHIYPYLYPFCVIAGLVSLLLCLANLCGNIIYLSAAKRETGRSVLKWAAVFEPPTVILTFIAGLVIWDYLCEAFSAVI